MLFRSVPEAERIVTVMTPNNPRALPAKKLAETVKQYNSEVEAAQSIREAVQLAKGYADKDGMILAFGSLSYLGDLIEEVRKGKET